mmetsp:Transcript_19905/g.25971  ORF Transcript_19905/g.25971 Transcript_19905/m.25971 type:complete len:804 (-) Transcript_19905:92-2503(-)
MPDPVLVEFSNISSLGDMITWLIECAFDIHHVVISWAILGQYLLHGAYGLIALVFLSFSFGWLFWLALSVILTAVQLFYALYLLLGISFDLTIISGLKFSRNITGLFIKFTSFKAHQRKQDFKACKTYKSYEKLSELDDKTELEKWKLDVHDYPNADVLVKTTNRLRIARAEKRLADLKFLLSGVLKRNHLGIHAEELHNKSGTKACVEDFQIEVERCLKALVDADENDMSLQEKLAFFKKERRSLGQSALCLSGGGSICMYHIGIIKGLIDADIYKHIRVLSGTSGGSIIAAMVACKTETEFRDYVIQDSVSTDFRHDGSQKAQGIRWFPPLTNQLRHFMSKGVLIDRVEFKRTCNYYYGDITFAEAYERTKRHVSISVTGHGTGSRLLLNHIASPHVTIASAVAASCALPGIMLPQPLEAKDAAGNLVTFDVDGTHYVDGSIAADLPFKRMSTLFNVSAFYVSQVNFHVSPFMRKSEESSHKSYYWTLLKHSEEDIRHRARKLAKLGVLPTFFGSSMTSVFKQKYHGDVTMVPNFTPMESIGLKAVMNPTTLDIRGYIDGGERAAWPRINRIRFMMRTEICLRQCVAKLRTMLIDRPIASRPESHNLEITSLDSCTSLSTLTNRDSDGLLVPPPPMAMMTNSPDRPYTDADEFGLLSDNDDEEEESDDNDVDGEEMDMVLMTDRNVMGKEEEEETKTTMNQVPFPPSSDLNQDENENASPNMMNGRKKKLKKRKKYGISGPLTSSRGAQLRWEMKLLEEQVSDLRSENIELRTRLSDIASLAEIAMSKSPPSPIPRRKNTC